jgi:hypothetical protein
MTRRFLVQFHPFDSLGNREFLGRFDKHGRDITFRKVPGMMRAVGGLAYMKNPHIVFSMDELVRYVLFR